MDETKDVAYIVYESTIARFERTIRRLLIVVILLSVMLFASNMAWLFVWNQYDYSDITVDSDDGGNASYIGASGIINNGESSGKEAD